MKDVQIRLAARKKENGWVSAYCPFHDDRNPSASVFFRNGEAVLLHCFTPDCPSGGMVDIRMLRYEPGIVTARISRKRGGGKGRRAPENKEKQRPQDGAGKQSEATGLYDQAAMELLLSVAAIEVGQILQGTFQERESAVRFWSQFMAIKLVPETWLSHPLRPLCGVGLYYPVVSLGPNGEIVRERIFHARFNSARIKSLYLPREEEREEKDKEGFWFYTPDPDGLFRKPLVIVEAPHNALKVTNEKALGVAAMGISRAERLYHILSDAGAEIEMMILDDRPSFRSPVLVRIVVADLDIMDAASLRI